MVSSNLTALAQQVEVEKALVAAGIAVDSHVGLDGKEDTQTISSNSDEYVTVYSTVDGEPHQILRLDARRALIKRVPGTRQPAFWIPEQGGEAPHRISRGDIKCYLDPEFDESEQFDGVNREWIDSIGLRGRTCNMMDTSKNNQRFTSQFERNQHMQRKHPKEWATIQEEKTRQRDQRRYTEDRGTREAMLELARSVAGRVPADETEAEGFEAPVRRGPGRPPKNTQE